MQYFTRDLRPVVGKSRLHLCNRRPLHPEVGIAPVLRILRMPIPLVADADAARTADSPIDNQQRAVSSIIEPVDAVSGWWVTTEDFHAGLAQLFQRCLVDAL